MNASSLFTENIVNNPNLIKENLIIIWNTGTNYYCIINKKENLIYFGSELERKYCECMKKDQEFICKNILNTKRHQETRLVKSIDLAIGFVETYGLYV
jgi:hypothetical protein